MRTIWLGMLATGIGFGLAGCAGGGRQGDEPAKAPAAAPGAVNVPLDRFEPVGDVYTIPGDALLVCSNGVVEAKVAIPAAGAYDIVLTLSGDEARNELPKFRVLVDGNRVGAETALTSADAKAYTVRATLEAGLRRLGIEFTNDIYVENEADRNLRVEGVVVWPAK
jgi:hypothetical protein